jgi:hypothetical protein
MKRRPLVANEVVGASSQQSKRRVDTQKCVAGAGGDAVWLSARHGSIAHDKRVLVTGVRVGGLRTRHGSVARERRRKRKPAGVVGMSRRRHASVAGKKPKRVLPAGVEGGGISTRRHGSVAGEKRVLPAGVEAHGMSTRRHGSVAGEKRVLPAGVEADGMSTRRHGSVAGEKRKRVWPAGVEADSKSTRRHGSVAGETRKSVVVATGVVDGGRPNLREGPSVADDMADLPPEGHLSSATRDNGENVDLATNVEAGGLCALQYRRTHRRGEKRAARPHRAVARRHGEASEGALEPGDSARGGVHGRRSRLGRNGRATKQAFGQLAERRCGLVFPDASHAWRASRIGHRYSPVFAAGLRFGDCRRMKFSSLRVSIPHRKIMNRDESKELTDVLPAFALSKRSWWNVLSSDEI